MIMSGIRPYVRIASVFIIAVLMISSGSSTTHAQEPVPDWPEFYNPYVMLDFNIEMSSEDWNTIVNDTTLAIEVPALFSAAGEAPILVSVRRKSATKLGDDKVSLKVDINEYTKVDGNGNDVCDPAFISGFFNPTCVEKWHGVKKLSLENGDDIDVISEGLAWFLNNEAVAAGLDFTPGMASWVTVTVNDVSKGVYVNVEQRDKQFLKNRDMWNGDNTWLYKYGEIKGEVKEAPDGIDVSPALDALCYLPFQTRRPCSQPNNFKDQLNTWINMEGLLTFGAVSAFMGSPDDLYNKNQNYYIVDYSLVDGRVREYLQWDLDSAFGGHGADASMYDQGQHRGDAYEEALVESASAPFREEYDAIMCQLLRGPFQEAPLHAAFDAIEAEIGAAVSADPNNNIDNNVAGKFDTLRQYVSDRIASLESQLTCAPPTSMLEVTITSPVDGATVFGSETVTADASAPADAFVTQVQFFVNAVSIFVDVDGRDGWSADWDTTELADNSTPSVTATATDSTGQTATDSVTVTVNNTTMHLGNLVGTGAAEGRGKWRATVTVTIHDSDHDVLPGAMLSGNWGGDFIGTDSCVTDSNGQCVMRTPRLNKNRKSVTFMVTGVSHSTGIYDPGMNEVPASVTINKP